MAITLNDERGTRPLFCIRKGSLRLFLVYFAPLVLLCAELASCAPTPNTDTDPNTLTPLIAEPPNAGWAEARELWNGVKKLRKELLRRKRDDEPTPTSTPDATDINLDNITAPEYVKELYRNLTKKPKSPGNQDRTFIRSLPALQRDPGEYSFPFINSCCCCYSVQPVKIAYFVFTYHTQPYNFWRFCRGEHIHHAGRACYFSRFVFLRGIYIYIYANVEPWII